MSCVKYCLHCKAEYECGCPDRKCECHTCGVTPIIARKEWWESKPAMERHERQRKVLDEIQRQMKADSTINPF